MPGLLVKMAAQAGDEIKAGEELAVVAGVGEVGVAGAGDAGEGEGAEPLLDVDDVFEALLEGGAPF